MMKKILHKIFAVALLFMSASCASTGRQIPHPPTYNDFIKLQTPNYHELNADYFLKRIALINCISDCDKSNENIDEKKAGEIIKKCIRNQEDERIMEELFQSMQFKEAMQFTPAEMNVIRHSQNSHAMVGAGIQSDINQPLGTELLELASAESPTGLALVSLIDRYFDLQSKETADSSLPDKIQAKIKKLLQTDPVNALSYYLDAYRLHMVKRDNEALQQLQDGNRQRKFIDYSKDRYFAVVETAESIGYSQFTARRHAINFATPTEVYSQLVALCKGLITTEKKEDARKECLRMGELIELSGHDTFENLQGLIIQNLVCRESTDPKDVELMSKISERQRTTLENSPKLLKIPFSEIPEPVWLQYFEIYVSKDEKAAGSFIEDYYSKTGQGDGK